MTGSLNEIVSNAQKGKGPCFECPAHADTRGSLVNPGLLNYEANLMFLTMDPSHDTNWKCYDNWSEYNAAKGEEFKKHMTGGREIQKLLNGIPGITIDDIWLADAIKCPVNNKRAGDINSNEAFDHCSEYLEREIGEVDPNVIITMGKDPAKQLLNEILDRDVGSIKTGTRDCGDIHETNPPIVISPHWSHQFGDHGWLDKHNNREKVQKAIRKVLD